jgi:hypothetical protein
MLGFSPTSARLAAGGSPTTSSSAMSVSLDAKGADYFDGPQAQSTRPGRPRANIVHDA